MKKLKNKCIAAMCRVDAALCSKQAASLWEYLLVIAIVCFIGAALISAITGTNGITGLWNSLYTKFTDTINSTL